MEKAGKQWLEAGFSALCVLTISTRSEDEADRHRHRTPGNNTNEGFAVSSRARSLSSAGNALGAHAIGFEST